MLLQKRALSLTLTFLASIDDAFILYLFQVIEEASDDPNDPYHYPVIRVLVYIRARHSRVTTVLLTLG